MNTITWISEVTDALIRMGLETEQAEAIVRTHHREILTSSYTAEELAEELLERSSESSIETR